MESRIRQDTRRKAQGARQTPLVPLFAFPLPLWILVLLLLATLSWAGPEPEQEQDNIARQYGQAKTYYQELATSDKGKKRESWLTSVTAFRSIYKAAPDHQVAPKSLFMLGKIFQAMFRQSGKPQDLDQAIASYEELSSKYAGNFLADDAFFILGTIYLAEKKDPDKAARAYAKIIAIYPEGDMAGAAEEQLLRIKQGTAAPGPLPTKEESGEKCLIPQVAEEPPANDLAAKKSGPATVLPIRHWSNKRYTRLIVETTGPVTFKHQELTGAEASQSRIYIDLHNSRLSPGSVKTIPIEDGLLRRVRNAQFDPKTVRVVLDTQTKISDYKVFTLADPFRVVIDVMSTAAGDKTGKPEGKEKSAGKGKEAGPAKKKGTPILAKQLGLGIKRIVIDPGHGGKDPGTCSPSGLKEKDIVLDVALRVARILKEKIGCEVILTRDRDVFIPLEERTALANAKEADLFLSIHVNAAPNHEARGIETYVLDLASNKDAMQLAARENATSAKQISDLQSILLDLMQNSKINESLKLAGLVQEEMVSGLNKKFSEVTNLGVKKAPFVVLIGAQMPAILTEIAFLSNPEEEKRLKNEAYLAEVANHISGGVAQYVESLSLAGNLSR